jgi:membrane-associated protease RseP (regulator of RpoE activity)
VSIDGQTFGSFHDASEYLRAHPGADVDLVVERNGETREVTATLGSENPNTGEHVGFLGVGPTFPTVRENPASAVWDGVKQMGTLTKASVLGLTHILSPKGVTHYVDTVVSPDAQTKKGVPDEARPTSIVGVVQVGSQLAHDGWVNVLFLLFGVNIFIGLFNLLPVLPFDGGHAVIVVYEGIMSKVRGRRVMVDYRKLIPVSAVVVIFLMVISLSAMFLDIQRLGQ